MHSALVRRHNVPDQVIVQILHVREEVYHCRCVVNVEQNTNVTGLHRRVNDDDSLFRERRKRYRGVDCDRRGAGTALRAMKGDDPRGLLLGRRGGEHLLAASALTSDEPAHRGYQFLLVVETIEAELSAGEYALTAEFGLLRGEQDYHRSLR